VPRARSLAAASALVLFAWPGWAAEDWHRCAGSGWEVTGAEAGDRDLVCEGVAAAEAFLSACGVRTATATRIRMVNELPLSCGVSVWGLFDARRDEILLGSPALCRAEAPAGSLFERLAPSLAFTGIVAHEATHAMLFGGGLGEDKHLEHEYIAAVVQMSVLPENARAELMTSLGLDRPVAIWEVNPLIHALQPELFAGRAWMHFSGEPDNCALLRAMAEGTLRLPDFSSF
jgi:hypothetical protein